MTGSSTMRPATSGAILHDVGSHGAIARPWRTHIGLPRRPAGRAGEPRGGERDQKRDDPDPGLA